MKRLLIFALVVAFSACSSDEPNASIPADLTGIWATYEAVYTDGSVRNVTTGESIFGVYAESIQIKNNGLYVPVIWKDATRYDFKKTDKGKLEQADDKLLLKEGVWNMEFSIIHHKDNELWLEYLGDIPLLGGPGTIYKLTRELNRTSY